MIKATIGGKTAVPVIAANVTVTFENPMLKDRDAWTMELPFPLSIRENIAVFGHLNRLDVGRRPVSFDDCCIYENNRLVIKGIGRVTTANDKEVRLQIKSGMQRIAYRSDFEQIYIDELHYDDADCSRVQENSRPLSQRLVDPLERWAFPQVYDEANEVFLNVPTAWYQPFYTADDHPDSVVVPDSYNLAAPAVQPSLKFVLSQVMGHMGYTMGYSHNNGGTDELYDAVGPCANLFVCSNNQGFSVAHALPHWTVKRFLDELRNLFNIVFVFDDVAGTVAVRRNEPSDDERVSYECLDEFTSNYTEEGEQYVGSSNLAYNLGESDNRPQCDDIPEDVLKHFEIRAFDTRRAMLDDIADMGYAEARKYVFRCPDGWYYVRQNEEGGYSTTRVVFQHLRRNEGDDTLTLNIVPVPLGMVEHPKLYFMQDAAYKQVESSEAEEIRKQFPETNGWGYKTLMESSWVPCMSSDTKQDESLTVQAAVEDDASLTKDEDERMEVMYLPNAVQEEIITNHDYMMSYTHAYDASTGRGIYAYPPVLTAPRLEAETETMAFYRLEEGRPMIGDLHEVRRTMESKVQVVIKFPTDNMPQPTKIHVFRNKLYLCDKIEAAVGPTGVDKVKTGYFYEIQS